MKQFYLIRVSELFMKLLHRARVTYVDRLLVLVVLKAHVNNWSFVKEKRLCSRCENRDVVHGSNSANMRGVVANKS